MIRRPYFLIGIFLFLHEINGQGTLTSCLGDQPFKSKDNTCSNFNEVCVKTEDPDCKSFLQTCSQCPPSNITNLRLMNLLTSSKDLLAIVKMLPLKNESASRFEILENKLSVLEAKVPVLLAIIYAIIILLILLILILLIEVRFKLITKCLEHSRQKDSNNYRILDSRKYRKEFGLQNANTVNIEKNNDEYMKLMTGMKEEMEIIQKSINSQIESKLEKITAQLKEIFVTLHSSMMFKMKGTTGTKMIEVKVNIEDSIVLVKRQICVKLNSTSAHDYKIMKLEFNGMILDDNQYLLSAVDSPSSIVDWVIDNSINHKDIIVVNAQGKSINGFLVQIHKDQKIADLKDVIHKLSNLRNVMILSDSGELQDGLTMAESNLIDDSLVRIIEKNDQELVIEFLFMDHQSMKVKYTATDTVHTLKNEISKELRCSTDEFELMFENKIMREDLLIICLEIASGSTISYFPLKKLNNVSLESRIMIGNCSEIHKAKNKLFDTEIYLKKYKFASVSKFLDSRTWQLELTRIKLIKSHQRFGKIRGFYMDDRIFCVEIDYLKSIPKVMDNGGYPFETSDIATWSKQILEGMKFLHDHDIILQYMKIADIFLDGNRNIILSGFGLAKYLNDDFGDNFLVEIERRVATSFPLMPPEVADGSPFKKPSDVWYFGYILFKMVTNKNPPYSLSLKETRYNNIMVLPLKSGISLELMTFVESCLKGKPEERLTVNELLEDDFIKLNQ